MLMIPLICLTSANSDSTNLLHIRKTHLDRCVIPFCNLFKYHSKQQLLIIILFMRNLFSGGLKDNKHLSYCFLTGILRVAKESIFSGLNNLAINSILMKNTVNTSVSPQKISDHLQNIIMLLISLMKHVHGMMVTTTEFLIYSTLGP